MSGSWESSNESPGLEVSLIEASSSLLMSRGLSWARAKAGPALRAQSDHMLAVDSPRAATVVMLDQGDGARPTLDQYQQPGPPLHCTASANLPARDLGAGGLRKVPAPIRRGNRHQAAYHRRLGGGVRRQQLVAQCTEENRERLGQRVWQDVVGPTALLRVRQV